MIPESMAEQSDRSVVATETAGMLRINRRMIKMSFSPNSVLGFRFNSSKYCSIHLKCISSERLRLENRIRLDVE